MDVSKLTYKEEMALRNLIAGKVDAVSWDAQQHENTEEAKEWHNRWLFWQGIWDNLGF